MLIRISSAQSKGVRLNILKTKNEFVNVKELGKIVGQNRNITILLTVCNLWLESYFAEGTQKPSIYLPSKVCIKHVFDCKQLCLVSGLRCVFFFLTPASKFQAAVVLLINPS